ncbi:receptor-type tyrosine-protein phosphatase H-like [Sphaeramia orbicularis]|uniref:receptor-type tyrosine-protein phosphatase H-like n=1 Tax=Sphaeramia orbicularis TaxID=375764 RepID=UPI00117D8F47|nr:receptor-type tyrosine-protein phosphatase H [Sphaeramia orbicularis]
MRTLSLKLTSDTFVLCVFLSLLWCVTESIPTSKTDMTTTTQSPTTQSPTTSPTTSVAEDVSVMVTKQNETTIMVSLENKAVTESNTSQAMTTDTETSTTPPTTTTTATTTTQAPTTKQRNSPPNVGAVSVKTQNETSVTLEWKKVENIQEYMLHYNSSDSLKIEWIPQPDENTVTHVVTELSPGNKYDFILFTVSEGLNSTGLTFTAATAPMNAENFMSNGQNETSITLTWNKVPDFLDYTLVFDDMTINITAQEGDKTVTYDVPNLTSGILYKFTLFTVFENVRSSGTIHSAPTAPQNTNNFKAFTQTETSITLIWDKVEKIHDYTLVFNESEINVPASSTQHTIFNLTAATLYNFTLFTVFETVKSSGVNLTAPTAPQNTDHFKDTTRNETSITLEWKKVADILDYTLVFNDMTINITAQEGDKTVTYDVPNLTNGILYNFTLFTVFEDIKSSGKKLSAATVPRNAEGFSVCSQNETSITLQWQKVDEILNYEIEFGERSISIDSATEENGILMYTISDLASGTLYHFTLFTKFANFPSSGAKYDAATVPPVLPSVNVTVRKVTSIVLEWESVREDWHYALTINGTTVPVWPKGSSNVVSYPVMSLEPGTEYPFTVTTIFMELNSTAYEGFTVTTIDCVNVDWQKTDSSITGMVQGLVSSVTATNGSDAYTSPGTNNVSFTNLYPGATYEMVFVYEKNSTPYPQCNHSLTIIPPSLSAVCKDWAAGYSIYIEWNAPYGTWSAVEVNVTDQTHTYAQNGEQHAEIPGFQPAKKYKVSIVSLSGTNRTERSKPFVFYCKTDERGVIAGSVMGVLLFGVLICAIVIIMLKRPDMISKKAFIRGSKQPLKNRKRKPIPVASFPSHFNQLDADENRGFSQEYENLGTVGTEQTQKAAILPENKAKNRFTNILPYDWSRVKLTSSNSNSIDDYINANYMPGYNSNREYIATQGPLPSTVNDFWKMIWEQRVKGIVMVTNCTEGGKTKCEQYWPADKQPIFHGQLTITLSSEQQETNWTLREFKLKHRQSSEERTVKHFHFTAWPDHGVPQGTEVLVQFRGLVRSHIRAEAAGTPTVVHCSAGVGRTGTIIALDVLLQQLEKEKAVDINGFVYKMRLSRSHMVQTESQYIFLHQCIMDILQTNDTSNENIYENADMIYANATALRELH